MLAIGSPTACPLLSGAVSVTSPLPTAPIVTVSLSGATPIVIDCPGLNFETSVTGSSVEPYEAPGAATVDAPAVVESAETPTTVQ